MALAVLLVFDIEAAKAQPQSDLQQQERLLFRQTLANAGDIDIAFRYASVATQLGDFEAAIGMLERILFFKRDLPRVRLELGLLYFRLGSYQQARSYFSSAIAGSNVPDEVRNRVEIFLKEIDRRLNTNQFSLFAQAGIRHQTNANGGPSSLLVRALGQDAILSTAFAKRADTSVFGLASARHVYDFETQNGDTFETNVTLYHSRQFQLSQYNLGFLELDVGPRFGIGDAASFSVRPYLIGTEVLLADRQYSIGGGGGVSLAWQTPYLSISPGVEYRRRGYTNSSIYTNARDQAGNLLNAYVNASGPLVIADLRWQLRLFGSANEARRSFYSFRQFGVDLGLTYEFDGFGFDGARRWSVSVFGGASRSRYQQPNALVDPNVRRNDVEWRIGSSLQAEVYERLGFGVNIQYSRIHSNIRNYSSNNFVVSGGPFVRF